MVCGATHQTKTASFSPTIFFTAGLIVETRNLVFHAFPMQNSQRLRNQSVSSAATDAHPPVRSTFVLQIRRASDNHQSHLRSVHMELPTNRVMTCAKTVLNTSRTFSPVAALTSAYLAITGKISGVNVFKQYECTHITT
jgi:hypothetical protein